VNIAPQETVQIAGRGNNSNSNTTVSQSGNEATGGNGGRNSSEANSRGGEGGDAGTFVFDRRSHSSACGCENSCECDGGHQQKNCGCERDHQVDKRDSCDCNHGDYEHHRRHDDRSGGEVSSQGGDGGNASSTATSAGANGGDALAGSNSADDSELVFQGVNYAPQESVQLAGASKQRHESCGCESKCDCNRCGCESTCDCDPCGCSDMSADNTNTSSNTTVSQSENSATGGRGGSNSSAADSLGGSGGDSATLLLSSQPKTSEQPGIGEEELPSNSSAPAEEPASPGEMQSFTAAGAFGEMMFDEIKLAELNPSASSVSGEAAPLPSESQLVAGYLESIGLGSIASILRQLVPLGFLIVLAAMAREAAQTIAAATLPKAGAP
jgi:hypothetical protein